MTTITARSNANSNDEERSLGGVFNLSTPIDKKEEESSTTTTTEFPLPMIDLSSFGPNGTLEEQQTTAFELRRALHEIGFCYIKGHGCPDHITQQAFEALHTFFDLPLHEKQTLEACQNPLYRGYNSIETGSHSCTPEEQQPTSTTTITTTTTTNNNNNNNNNNTTTMPEPDLKESFTIGATGSSSPMHGPNQWPNPQTCPGFEMAMNCYWDTVLQSCCRERLLPAFARSLDMPNHDFFINECNDPVAQMVLLRYPPNPLLPEEEEEEEEDNNKDNNKDNNNNETTSEESCNTTTNTMIRGRRGCGAHTDCGFLTILAQEDNGTEGLQVRRADGTWVSAKPIPGTFVLNLGDMAAHWTNDFYKSTEHRVYNASSTKSRHSIPFFINCNFDTQVSCLPSCRRRRNLLGGRGQSQKNNHQNNDNEDNEVDDDDDDDDDATKYETVKAGEYILQKLGLMHLK